MIPLYHNIQDEFDIQYGNSVHVAPHLHSAMECIFITDGELELGVGQEFYHMEKGDFAIVFPELIHHYQVFRQGRNRAIHLSAEPTLSGSYLDVLQARCPECPVIKKEDVHSDIIYALNRLLNESGQQQAVLHQAFVQIILAQSIPYFRFMDKSMVGSDDIVYQAVSYIAKHFREEVSLTEMAKDLGFSPYTLSRVFSGTFHRNFNQYLNEKRLEYAVNLILYSKQSMLEICENSGFKSQRTFNRVFQERYHVSPREYRNSHRKL